MALLIFKINLKELTFLKGLNSLKIWSSMTDYIKHLIDLNSYVNFIYKFWFGLTWTDFSKFLVQWTNIKKKTTPKQNKKTQQPDTYCSPSSSGDFL